MMWDGASFDSNQHTELLSDVDDRWFKKFVPQLALDLGFDAFEVDEIMKSLLCHKVQLVMYYPKSANKLKMFTCWLLGTTFTGHPARTTVGNTLRSKFYTAFLQFKAGEDVF